MAMSEWDRRNANNQECDMCHGSGKIPKSDDDKSKWLLSWYKKCPNCNGKGYFYVEDDDHFWKPGKYD